MPHFCTCGGDEYICQKCGKIFCSREFPSKWRPDITGNKSAGNVCPNCRKNYKDEIRHDLETMLKEVLKDDNLENLIQLKTALEDVIEDAEANN